MNDDDSITTLVLAFCLAVAVVGLYLGSGSPSSPDLRSQPAQWAVQKGPLLGFD
jgi:hypothetical protein